ncbi:MAG: DNA-3-methyladenine glycosylase I [Verrucomicrobia bacterium]|nr:DNA-3-methyladenine glycosylase I [Verrucomicrobiota bacterium]
MSTPTHLPDGIVTSPDRVRRCWWGAAPPVYQAYHDDEWGRPVADDCRLFEKLCLEGFQSGLSWLTILRKRDNFRRAFAGFDCHRVAGFGDAEVARLLGEAGIIRHRGKIEATIRNARRALEMVAEFGSLAAYFWRWEPAAAARPRQLDKAALAAMAHTPASTAMSKDLRQRGWSYVGPTTCYAFMQAMGLVNDHLDGCGTRPKVEQARRQFVRPGRPPR